MRGAEEQDMTHEEFRAGGDVAIEYVIGTLEDLLAHRVL